jgi:hypothetical protein
MQHTGLILRDRDGYEWDGDCLLAKNQKLLAQWSNTHGRDFLRVPSGFEKYDPFEEQPALFAIAAAIPFGDGPEIRKQIVGFANKWGNLTTDSGGVLISEWNNSLGQVRSIAQFVGHATRAIDNHLTFLASNIAVRYSVNRQLGHLKSAMLVEGLFNCLVVQAIEAVVNDAKFTPCKFCGTPISLADSRKGKIFCGDSCRVQEYKRRKKLAIEMRSKGHKLRDISLATTSAIRQVKLWLGE